jgi:hypothetical protein
MLSDTVYPTYLSTPAFATFLYPNSMTEHLLR